MVYLQDKQTTSDLDLEIDRYYIGFNLKLGWFQDRICYFNVKHLRIFP